MKNTRKNTFKLAVLTSGMIATLLTNMGNVEAKKVYVSKTGIINTSNLISNPIIQDVDFDHLAMTNNKSKGSIQAINFNEYGSITIPGMPEHLYRSTLNPSWAKVSNNGQYQELSLHIAQAYSYADLENYMYNLANHYGVELFVIGKTLEGRNIYSISIDYPSDKPKATILLTGSIHARETAGGLFILKQYGELLKKADSDPRIKRLLEHVRFVAVPVVNPDGREMVLNSNNNTIKSNASGVDLNRNFPSVNAGQLKKGVSRDPEQTDTPSLNGFYSGPYLGSEPETIAMMGWLNRYVPIASYYIDYHQQGGDAFAGKVWDTKQRFMEYKNFALQFKNFLNSKTKGGHYFYKESKNIDPINGRGGTLTDYATSIAMGFTYSPTLGRMVLNIDGIDTPLMVFQDLDNYPKQYRPINPYIFVSTLEIGMGNEYLGYSAQTRELLKQEYDRYNFKNLLEYLAKKALGPQQWDNLMNSNLLENTYQRIRM